jgi:hypothetical protein
MKIKKIYKIQPYLAVFYALKQKSYKTGFHFIAGLILAHIYPL